MKRIFVVYILSFMLLMLLMPGCAFLQEKHIIQPEQQEQLNTQPPKENIPVPPQENPPSGPSSPLQVALYISHAPLLNEVVEVICTISSRVSCPNSTAEIRLPDGAMLVSGNLTWEGDVAPVGEPVSFSTKIVFNEAGKWKIKGVAQYMYSETSGWSDLDTIYLSIGANHSEFGWPPTGPVPVQQVAPGDIEGVESSTWEPPAENLPPPPAVSP